MGRDDGTDDVVYFQVGQQTFADYAAGTAASSPTYNYVYGSYIDEIILRTGSGGNRYYHRNQQYSITALTNASGTIVERYAYTAYGQPTFLDGGGTVISASAESNRYTYTGREWDQELHLYHYRARMYDPVAGRFCSRDPIAFEGSPFLLYGHVGGNTIVRLDPLGLWFTPGTFMGDYEAFLFGADAPADPAILNYGSEVGFGVAGAAVGGLAGLGAGAAIGAGIVGVGGSTTAAGIGGSIAGGIAGGVVGGQVGSLGGSVGETIGGVGGGLPVELQV